jgi:hypothetical protein
MTHIVHHAPDLDRVRANTWPEVNDRLDRRAGERLREYAAWDEDALGHRITQIEREWDFERVLEAEASTMGIAGLILSVAVDRRFLLLPAIVSAMVLLHALQGWYPLLPLFRRIGLRSQDEIAREMYAIKVLRGDFAGIAETEDELMRRADAVWRAVCA